MLGLNALVDINIKGFTKSFLVTILIKLIVAYFILFKIISIYYNRVLISSKYVVLVILQYSNSDKERCNNGKR